MHNCTAGHDGAAVFSSDAVSITDSIIKYFSVPSVFCYDSDHGATDRTYFECIDYANYEELCGVQDDDDFSASAMCCTCGGGVATWPHTIFYHASSSEVFLLDSSTFQNNDLPMIQAEHENTVAARNCEGLNTSDVTRSVLLDCASQTGYCLIDYCTDITTGFEARGRACTWCALFSFVHQPSPRPSPGSVIVTRMALGPTQT